MAGPYRAARLLSWLDERLDRPLTVADMAAHAGYSARTFTRRFHAQVGTSPWRWVARRRIVRAQQMLEDSALPVDQVAHRCGFATTVAFRRRFRETVHVSPSEYRRSFRTVSPPGP